MAKFFSIFILLFSFSFQSLISKDIVISRNFVLFTSKNLEGYLQPLFTTVEQSLNNFLFGTSNLDGKFRVTLNLGFASMLIPDSHKWFDAEVPEGFSDTNITLTAQMRDGQILGKLRKPNKQPTIFGGSSVPIFAAPQNHIVPDSFYKTIAYPEGLHIEIMPGLPVLQLIFETPLHNEIRFRFFTFPIQGESFIFYSLGLNQRFDHFVDLFGFDNKKNLNLNISFHRMYRGASFDLFSYSFGLNVSNQFHKNVLGYLGIQFENLHGIFKAIKDTTGLNQDIVQSPFSELREAKPVEINLKTLTKWQIKGGFTFFLPFGFLNFDLSYASQPMISLGFGIFLGDRKNVDE